MVKPHLTLSLPSSPKDDGVLLALPSAHAIDPPHGVIITSILIYPQTVLD